MLFRILPVAALAVLLSCANEQSSTAPPIEPPGAAELHPPSYDDLDLAAGQTVFVPIFSHVYQDGKRRPFNLVATLSVRNTDLAHPIRITKVRYYDSKGALIRDLAERPLSLGPLASLDFVVDEHDDAGSGTSFIVEWVAGQEVHEPVIEAVMASTALSQGMSFTAQGKVIRTLHSSDDGNNEPPAPPAE